MLDLYTVAVRYDPTYWPALKLFEQYRLNPGYFRPLRKGVPGPCAVYHCHTISPLDHGIVQMKLYLRTGAHALPTRLFAVPAKLILWIGHGHAGHQALGMPSPNIQDLRRRQLLRPS